jgi:hypothetical protein
MTPLEKTLQRIDELASPDDWVMAATVRGLMIGYDARWGDAQRHIVLTGTEKVLTAPLINVETGRQSRTFSLVGILDKTAADGEYVEIFDHKTTSSDISEPDGFYWRQLVVDSQPSLYELLAMLNGEKVSRVTWDVTRKPTIRPKEISKKDHAETLSSSVYCGFDLSTETLAYLADNQRENAEMFAHRVAADAIANPDRFYARRHAPRTREQLAEYAKELWDVGDQIRQARNAGRHTRNSSACFNYNRPCPFLGLCAGSDHPESERWKQRESRPDSVGGDDILSNSRMRMFQQCQRKHHYHYNLKIERVREERDEALFFGSMWGQVLDAYWQSFSEESFDGNCIEQPGESTGSRQCEAGLVG